MTPRPLLQRLAGLRSAMPRTPISHLPHGRLDLRAKLEYCNPNGSAKDRSAFWILKNAIERGEITEATTVVESSSGNFALSLASFCRVLGIGFVPVIDPNVNASTESFLRMLCDRVEKVTERDDSGGFLSTRLTRVAQLRSELAEVYWPNQYGNPDALSAHYRLTGEEICDELSHIDYLFVGTSTGGTISGLSIRAKERWPDIRVIAVDAEGSAIFGGEPGVRRLPGLGSSIRPPLCERALIDDVVLVPELAAVRGCHALLREYGLYAGGSTGSVYAAISRYFAGGVGNRPDDHPVVAFLCADRGNAYADTVYDSSWVSANFGEGVDLSAQYPQILPA
ncbi:2,3-diaminopropionate biosynthesis protein SbnA [Actinopolyspora erythraea]|uniref:2,3-diaminopropionate biosynthesis protein SbnA n=1 Tax=Actinopolyspora erythraea TaxID=414996 RepID=A0A223RVI8_9ACTN|nr:2,3-diaminopropionate biosynthesis protein SbnA [Actinopolyspora erythraea]ASU79888.1 2,3-diaminopropionate biosynthesis protein SbnA [Actinopolyspora erythraea]